MTNNQQLIKRFFDLLIAVSIAPLVLPVCVIIALVIKFSSIRNPFLFRQIRVGKDGTPFTMYKFRSMIPGDHTLVTPRNYDGSLKIDPDDKTTRMGRFMRRLSLDELPQIINVFTGNMSLVGPRPELPFHAEQYDQQSKKRLAVKPGITGWAQVQGRNNLNLTERHQLDVEYIENYSIFFDIKILFATFFKIFSGEGLYQKKRSLARHSKSDSRQIKGHHL